MRRALVDVGYAEDGLAADYRFVNYLGDDLSTCTLPLLAFASGPRDYRKACAALGFSAPGSATDALLHQARGAGAALCLAAGPREVLLFQTEAERPTQIGNFPRSEIGRAIRRDPDLWRPESVLRAKGLTGPRAWQVTLGDLGLVPLLDRQIAERLRSLIKDLFVELSAAGADLGARDGRARTQFPEVVRLVFWLVTARTLIDRDHQLADRFGRTAGDALHLAALHNGVIRDRSEPLGDRAPLRHRPDLRDLAWDRVRAAPYFRNLPSDLLAHLFEEVLVTEDVRKKLSVHATPRWLAELAASLVPWAQLPPDRQRVVELCAGHGPFLLACLEPLRRLRPDGLDGTEAHQWLVDRVRAVEIDVFSREVCRLSLTAAVYPDGDGWDLRCEDVFSEGVVERAVQDAGVVLCNPPFERARGAQHVQDASGPEALVRRILDAKGPVSLALLLPRRVVEARRSPLYALLAERFARIDTVLLPDRVFAHSDAETALLVASAPGKHAKLALRTARVADVEPVAGHPTQDALRWESASRGVGEVSTAGPLVAPLQALWHQLRHHPRLGAIAEVHKGIEFHRSLREAEHLVSTAAREGFAPGVRLTADLHPLRSPSTCYLNVNPAELRRGGEWAWDQPKVLVNAARVSRGPWRAVASVDHVGRWAYQNLHGVWPTSAADWPLELIAAVCAGPVASAHLAVTSGKRHLQINHWATVPLPHALDRARLVRLVSELADLGDDDIPAARMMEIDALVLEGYRLPARVERDLLRFFDGHERKGVAGFVGYPGKETASAFHLRELLAEAHRRATPARLLELLPTFDDPGLSERLSLLG